MMYHRLQTITTLLLRDTRVFKKHIIARFIDACVWTSIVLFVSQYIMPQFGISSNFGAFIMIGNIAAWGMFEVGTNVSILISDLLGIQSISYYLTLPIPQSWIFIRIGLSDAFKSFISTLPMIPIGKIVLVDHVSCTHILYGKLIFSYFCAHLFFGFFGLFLASITPNLDYITTIKLRIIFPLWFLGCYQFTWHMLYKSYPKVAYLNLLNPVVYIMEGMRSTVISEYQLLPYSLCMVMIILFTIAFGYLGIKGFKKRLDCLA
ncbi:hypothetical protein HYV11_00015 [Candidatus Dependentiae bacterium]|nr:hypothetical protein [Candidatus Dependentiae bacterium]